MLDIVPFQEPIRSPGAPRITSFPAPIQSLFANDSKIDDEAWILADQADHRSISTSDYSCMIFVELIRPMCLAESKTVCTSMLEIYDLPEGAKNYQVDMLLDSLKQRNCSLKWIADGRVIAIFESASAALAALQQVFHCSYNVLILTIRCRLEIPDINFGLGQVQCKLLL